VLPAQIRALAAADDTLYALTQQGALWRWTFRAGGHDARHGAVAFRSLARVDGVPRMTAVVAADHAVCALAADTAVWCWRDPSPYGTAPRATAPAVVPGLRDVQQIAAGGETVCALDRAGAVWCWGNTRFEPMGPPTQPTPQQVPGIAGATQLSVATTHACVRDGAGAVRCWGRGSWGELGDGSRQDRATPVVAQGLPPVEAVVAGTVHTCALAGARAYCWGAGMGTRPAAVDAVEGVASLALSGYVYADENAAGTEWLDGHAFVLARRTDGTVQAWSSSQRNYLEEGDRTPATRVQGLANVRVLAAGSSGAAAGVACAVTDVVQCWSLDAELPAMGVAPLQPFTEPPPAPPAVQIPTSPGSTCTGQPTAAYHLRPTHAMRRGGPSIDTLSPLTVLERGTLRRGNTVLYRVRTAEALEGWTFLLPDRLDPNCPPDWRLP